MQTIICSILCPDGRSYTQRIIVEDGQNPSSAVEALQDSLTKDPYTYFKGRNGEIMRCRRRGAYIVRSWKLL